MSLWLERRLGKDEILTRYEPVDPRSYYMRVAPTFDVAAYACVVLAALVRVGVREVAICPGSRSTPLTIALASHPDIAAVPILDERSAAFWALGAARRSHRPVADRLARGRRCAEQ